MDARKQVLEAVQEAQFVLAEHIQPGPRDCAETIEKLTSVLDNDAITQAVEEEMDDKNNRGPQDSSRINIHEDYEVQYWTKALGVSKEKLEQAVKKVGVSADAVRKELAA